MTFSNPTRGRRAFTPEQVGEIRQLYARGQSQAAIARIFQVNSQTIGRLLRGDTYISFTPDGNRAPIAEVFREQKIPITPQEQQEAAARIMARVEALGPIRQPEPRELTLAEKRQAEFERIFREVGYREAQEYTQECLREDLAAARKKLIETPPIRGGFGMAIPAADDPPDELPQGLLDNLPPKA